MPLRLRLPPGKPSDRSAKWHDAGARQERSFPMGRSGQTIRQECDIGAAPGKPAARRDFLMKPMCFVNHNETYKIIAGKEYYQIDVEEKEMIKLFINTIL